MGHGRAASGDFPRFWEFSWMTTPSSLTSDPRAPAKVTDFTQRSSLPRTHHPLPRFHYSHAIGTPSATTTFLVS